MKRLLAPAVFLVAILANVAIYTASAEGLDGADEKRASPPAFIEAACGGCHGVEPPFLSPNRFAPTFESIANREGLTEETLSNWLSGAHNYPEDMDFDLERSHVEQIAHYMLTLRKEGYEPDQ